MQWKVIYLNLAVKIWEVGSKYNLMATNKIKNLMKIKL